MKRYVIVTVLRLCGEAILFTMIVGIIIAVIGYRNQWDTSIAYSNAFFMAGCLVMVAGGLSRLGAAQEWNSFQLLYAESFRGKSSSEIANLIITSSSSVRIVILGLLSGILLIIISVFVVKAF